MSYWLIIDERRVGPLTLEEVIAHPRLTPVTPVWHEGMDDWAEAALLPELAVLFANNDTPLPPPVTEPQPNRSFEHRRPQADPAPKMPSTYLIPAIIVTIFCCAFIPGVIAIYFASKVSPAYYQGDYAKAERMSDRALIWVLISFVSGLICCPFSVLYSLLTAAV